MSEAEMAVGEKNHPVQTLGSGAGEKWTAEIRYTWAVALLICVLPALVYGAAFPAGFLLIGVVVFGLPTGLAALLIKDNAWKARLWRRLVVLSAISLTTFTAVSQTDKLTPSLATPIVEAIEQYHTDTATHPAALSDLTPRYLAELPIVRVAISQPPISYAIRDGRPRLMIPSARGDAFANHEYDFEAKVWVNNR